MTVLSKACVCGHDHRTERNEPISLCLECSCMEWTPRCQNCGAEASGSILVPHYEACSRRCALQIEYAVTRGVPATKLTREDARTIRASGEPGVALADRFGISQQQVCNIRKGRVWSEAA